MGTSSSLKPKTIAKSLAASSATMMKDKQTIEISINAIQQYISRGWKRVN